MRINVVGKTIEFYAEGPDNEHTELLWKITSYGSGFDITRIKKVGPKDVIRIFPMRPHHIFIRTGEIREDNDGNENLGA